MATSKKEPAEAVQGKAPPTFSKSHILTFKRYANRRDLLTQLLEDGKTYTLDQIDSLIQNFMKKGKVK